MAFQLPDDFLNAPAPNIKTTRINFIKTTLPEYADCYAVILDNALSQPECDDLLRAAEATTNNEWERAQVNIGGGRQQLFTDVRNCGRIIWDSSDVVDRIWKRIEHVPEVREIVQLRGKVKIMGNGPVRRDEVWRFTRPNERMRFLKYTGGEYFRPHCDGAYETPDGSERSYFTMHLYLNNAGAAEPMELAPMDAQERLEAMKGALIGGATSFHSMHGIGDRDVQTDVDVLPKTGRILLFQHRNLLHSGDDVVQGVKYTMRTDLMYALESVRGEIEDKSAWSRFVEQVKGKK